MILGDPDKETAEGANVTLDELFRRAALRRPGALALIDPPNRATFTDGAPRQLTYAEADRIISAIAGRLRRLGLQTDAVVALQLPNTVESILVMLAVLRAGMIAAPMPLLWRKQEITAALSRVGAKIIITSTRIGSSAQCDVAMQAAAELFPIRYVCAFGDDIPDGVVPFDDLFAGDTDNSTAAIEREDVANHLAAITFDVTANGLIVVARSHAALIAGGLSVLRESASSAVMLSTVPIGSFAGLALTLVPWLLSGGTLALHHPFDDKTFIKQCAAHRCDTVVLPGALIDRLARAGYLQENDLKTVLAFWRAPERIAEVPPWHGGPSLANVCCFGEAGLLVTNREATRHLHSAASVEIARTGNGTLALRGPMVPSAAFPPGAERSREPHLELDRSGFLDTGYTCRREDDALVVTGPPAGLVCVGGYRFRTREIDTLVESLDGGATIAALPDALTGQCLAGHAPDSAICQQLAERGANPLIAGAFRVS